MRCQINIAPKCAVKSAQVSCFKVATSGITIYNGPRHNYTDMVVALVISLTKTFTYWIAMRFRGWSLENDYIPVAAVVLFSLVSDWVPCRATLQVNSMVLSTDIRLFVEGPKHRLMNSIDWQCTIYFSCSCQRSWLKAQ